jgi:4-diphosphocytidyl-2-C-methyl-D-erythritol kinase
MRTVAPAKINWTLEVLGRREDGYHEVRSVMQAIDLCDEVFAERSKQPIFETADGKSLAEDDLTVRAAKALEERVGRALPARIRVEKRIPVASGLGGGSSDAAAVLRLLNRLYELRLTDAELSEVAAGVGSDVPFFIYGGTALVEGRGERVSPLRDARETWLVLLVPPHAPADKTAAMYASLMEGDFSDGSAAESAVGAMQAGGMVDDWLMSNAFERAALQRFNGLGEYRYALLSAGARTVYLAGSGPGLFAVANVRTEAADIAKSVRAGGGKVVVARTLGTREATAVTD